MGSDVIVEKDGLVVRRMRDVEDDYELMIRWRNSPHVRRWWNFDQPPLTLETAVQEYRPDTAPVAPSTACIVELHGRPIGFMQFYKWSAYGDEASEVGIPFDDRTWGLDIFIGERDQVGRGLGTRMVDLLCEHLESEFDASSIALSTALDNAAAIRCYEKAGFAKVREVLDTDTRHGRRIKSWLMVRTKH